LTNQKIPNFTKWANAFCHGQRSLKKAKFFEVGHEMASLATLEPCTKLENVAVVDEISCVKRRGLGVKRAI